MLESGSVLEQMTCPGNRCGSRAEIISELCALMDYRMSSDCRSTPYGMKNKLVAVNRQHPNTLQTIH